MIEHEAALVAAVEAREAYRRSGKIVVFTNGCFDILHAGHVGYLQWARAQGDVLIVGLNDDASVKRLKGATRPIVPFEQRAFVLGGLRAVDLVVGFQEATPIELIAALCPDVHIKSSQYRIEDLPEREVVDAGGGRIMLAPHQDRLSSTDIIAKIRLL